LLLSGFIVAAWNILFGLVIFGIGLWLANQAYRMIRNTGTTNAHILAHRRADRDHGLLGSPGPAPDGHRRVDCQPGLRAAVGRGGCGRCPGLWLGGRDVARDCWSAGADPRGARAGQPATNRNTFTMSDVQPFPERFHTENHAASSMAQTSDLRLAWRDGVVAFVAGRLFYSLIGYLIWLTGIRPPEADQFYANITPVLEGPSGALLGVWQRWDGIHYQTIAEQGYNADYLSAFFPLYPLLARALSWLTGLDVLPALIIVSNLAFLFSLVLLYRLVSTWVHPRLARITLLSLVLFPTAFFFYALYPQSLLLMWSLIAFGQARQQRWWGAAGAGLLAGLTHGSAVFLCAPLAWAAWHDRWREPVLASVERLVQVSTLRSRLSQRLVPTTRQPVGAASHGTPAWQPARLLSALLAPVAPLLGMAAFEIWGRLAGLKGFTQMHNQGWSRTFHWPWQVIAGDADPGDHLRRRRREVALDNNITESYRIYLTPNLRETYA
jgi:hypothetical protein